MPYENEPSDYKASGNNVKEIMSSKIYETLTYHDTLKDMVIHGLKYLESKALAQYIKTDKESMHEKLYCIDGSFVNLGGDNSELMSLRIASAVLNIGELFSIEKDRFGNPNPHHVAKIFQNPGNIYINAAFPSRNTYVFEDNHFLTMRESFEKALVTMFDLGLAKNMTSSFMEETNKIYNLNSNSRITDLPFIKELLGGIREESVVFTTQKEIQKLMLMMEAMLSQHILSELSYGESGLIILDGRLQNEDIGVTLKDMNKEKIQTSETMLMGVQKTGRLNILLSKIHDILKLDNDEDLKDLADIREKYRNGKSILLVLDREFKKICGLPDSGNGNYGRDCLYITQAPGRKEFVFTLPEHIFNSKKFKGDAMELFKAITGVFEFANTDLYLKNKGVLLANVASHINASLNVKYTNVLSNEGKQNPPVSDGLPKKKM